MINIEPDSAKEWNNKGVSLGKLGRDEEAIKSFEKAIDDYKKTNEVCPDKNSDAYNAIRVMEEILKTSKRPITVMMKKENEYSELNENLLKAISENALDRVNEY